MSTRALEAVRGLRRGVKAAPLSSLSDRDVRREWDAVRDAVPKIADVRIHDLRHTAASRMVAAGVPIFDVAKVLGHSNIQMTMRYAHCAPDALAGVKERLDARGG